MKAIKFNFGEDFEAQNVDRAEAEARALEERLHQAAEDAFQKGFASGKVDASGEIAKELAAAMDRVVEQMSELFGQRAQLEDRMERDATQLAFAMAQKLATSALEMHPDAEIEALITECLETCREQPKVLIRLSERQCGPMTEKIEEMKRQNGFAGDVIVVSDEEIRDGDCVVEWPDGGAERRADQISSAIEKLVQSFVMKPPPVEAAGVECEAKSGQQDAPAPDDEASADSGIESGTESDDETRDNGASGMEQPGAL